MSSSAIVGQVIGHHPSMALLAVKLLLAPSFVVGASLAARRFGPRVGVVSLAAFVVVYGRLAARLSWAASMLAGWLAFAVATVAFSALSIPAGVALVLAGVGLVVALAWLPRPGRELLQHAPPPVWDLPLRAGCALALVLALTGIAGWLGPQLSGLLAPFPVITTVLAIFTHGQRGTDELLRLLRGLLSGFGAFALFCFTLAVSLNTLDTATAFALATGLALAMQAAMLTLTQLAMPSRAS
jgi:hypothetical protein